MDLQTVAFIASLLGMAVGGIWKLTRVETALRECINASRVDVEEKQDRHSREFGETIAAIRQKVADIELFAANHYVRRDGFTQVQAQLTSDIQHLGDKIEERFIRLEAKIDTKT